MSEPTSEAYEAMLKTPYIEGGDGTRAAVDRVLAAETARIAAQQEQDAARYETAGSLRIERPVVVEAPAPKPEPVLTLPERFAPYAAHFARAEAAAQRVGFTSYFGAVGMLAGLQGHEVTPSSATPAERLARADAVHDQLVDQHGVEGAEKITANWRAAVSALGIGDVLAKSGFDTNRDLIEFVARRWAAEVKR